MDEKTAPKLCPACQRVFDEKLAEEMAKISHPFQWWGGRTYAQHGDDLMLLNIFSRMKIKNPSYLDIGAHDPFLLSNTALLYERGSRGINVEANPKLMEAFYKYRPDDININIGVGPEKGSMTFYYDTETSGRNSFMKEAVEKLGIIGQKELSVTTIWDIVSEHANGKFPDILSIDIEGLDFEVLKTIPYDISKPKVICVEIVTRGEPHEEALREFLTNKGYFSYCWTGSNLFFIDDAYLDCF